MTTLNEWRSELLSALEAKGCERLDEQTVLVEREGERFELCFLPRTFGVAIGRTGGERFSMGDDLRYYASAGPLMDMARMRLRDHESGLWTLEVA